MAKKKRRGLGKAVQKIWESGQVALDRAKFLPLVPYVPAMNGFIKMRDKNWKFTTNVEKTATRFYELYVKPNSFDYDSSAADNFEDKVQDSMNGTMNSLSSGLDHVIPPELISVVVQTVVQMVSQTAKAVKEGKATKQEENIVKATEQAKAAVVEASYEAEAEGKRQGTAKEKGLVDYLPWILGLVALGLIFYAIFRNRS